MENLDVITIGEAMAMFVATETGDLAEVEHFMKRVAGAELNVATGSPAASYIFMGVALFASVWLTLIVKPANNQNLPLGAHHA